MHFIVEGWCIQSWNRSSSVRKVWTWKTTEESWTGLCQTDGSQGNGTTATTTHSTAASWTDNRNTVSNFRFFRCQTFFDLFIPFDKLTAFRLSFFSPIGRRSMKPKCVWWHIASTQSSNPVRMWLMMTTKTINSTGISGCQTLAQSNIEFSAAIDGNQFHYLYPFISLLTLTFDWTFYICINGILIGTIWMITNFVRTYILLIT